MDSGHGQVCRSLTVHANELRAGAHPIVKIPFDIIWVTPPLRPIKIARRRLIVEPKKTSCISGTQAKYRALQSAVYINLYNHANFELQLH